ncbi:MAG TPA: Fur family transcriptional regulator [Polyangia bacterium]
MERNPHGSKAYKLVAEHMENKGLRSTEPRRLIIDTFLASHKHLTIDELLAQVRKRNPRLGYVTVYRTLKLLSESGAALEHEFGDGLTRFEPAGSACHHDHLVCLQCRSITEFEAPEIEALQSKIAARHGFEVQSHKHVLYGLCPNCRSQKSKIR